jgi:glutathione S-transferase
MMTFGIIARPDGGRQAAVKGESAVITIYAATNIPPFLIGAVRDLRAVWAAEELGLAYKIHWLDAYAGEHRADWFRAINPFVKFPAIEDGEVRLFESATIVAYMADKARRLIPPPGAPERTAHDQWLYAALNTLEPSVFQIFISDFAYKDMEGIAAFRERFVTTARERLGSLDKVLARQAYVTSDDFAAADIVMTHMLTFIRDKAVLDGFEHVQNYIERCTARPAYQKALAIQTAGRPAEAA